MLREGVTHLNPKENDLDRNRSTAGAKPRAGAEAKPGRRVSA